MGRTPFLPFAAGLLVLACAETPVHPSAGAVTAAADAKGGGKGGGGGGGDGDATVLVADVAIGDAAVPNESSTLQSTCPATDTRQWHVNFGHSGCLIVRPTGATYELTDDVRLVVAKEKGKNGRITHVRLLAQDVIGDAGTAHETDAIAVADPIVPVKSGFTLHVHASGVPVWRLSGHTGGERVEVIGTIAIGDVVYRP